MPNFAPITALAIFTAAYMPWKKAAGLTLVVRLISDIFLGFFSWPMMLAVYASHLAGIVFGVWIKNSSRPPLCQRGGVKEKLYSPSLPKRGLGGVNFSKVFVSSLGSSIIFFLVTNFAFLYSNYPHTLAGILQAYINGLPFLRGTMFGDLVYSFAFFGAYALASMKFKFANRTNLQMITNDKY